MFLQFLLSVSKKRKKKRKRKKAITIESTHGPLLANGFFDALSPIDGCEDIRVETRRQMDHIIARKTSGHPSRVPPFPSRCRISGQRSRTLFHGLFTR